MVNRIQHIQQNPHLQVSKEKQSKENVSFNNFLKDAQKVKVSKHANDRLHERNIQINAKQWQVISEKMSEAKQKGVTESLIVMNNATLVVNTKNNMVVTAMNSKEASTRIFTNINGAILIND